MPHMTGLELAAQLRGDGADIPILLVTAQPSPAVIARAAELGIEKVLSKPPTKNDLLSFINAYKIRQELAASRFHRDLNQMFYGKTLMVFPLILLCLRTT